MSRLIVLAFFTCTILAGVSETVIISSHVIADLMGDNEAKDLEILETVEGDRAGSKKF